MSAPQFTPGPWHVSQADRDYPIRIRDDDGELVLATADDGGHVDPQFALPDEVILANARLMAASPRLYEALDDLIARCDAQQRPGGGSMVPPSARAALAKVRGE